jgi:hypothetical protein
LACVYYRSLIVAICGDTVRVLCGEYAVLLVILVDDSARAHMCAQCFFGLYGFVAALPI